MSCFLTTVNKTQIKLHTLGTNSWKIIKDLPSKITYGQQGISVSGTVNWLALHSHSHSPRHVIVSLSLERESYQEISLPDYGILVMLSLCKLRDCLCIFSHSISFIFNDVWLMKEFGNKESWIKLMRLPSLPDDHRGLSQYHCHIEYISEDDNQVLIFFKEFSEFKWAVYDSKSRTIETTKIADMNLVVSNVESLISP
jgi:F-box interacting protein